MKKCLIALAIASVLTCGSSQAQQVPDSNDKPSVILIAPESVQELLITHFELPIAALPDETARATFLHRARQEIGELLATEGYFTPTLNLRPAEDANLLALEINLGQRTLVSTVNIEFRGAISAASSERLKRVNQLRTAWRLPAGRPFRSSDWEEAKAALLARVARRDYAAAQIEESRAEVDPATASAKLSLVLDSGPAFRFGELAISGLERYDEKLVTRLAPFHAGAPYRQEQLLGFQTALQNLPHFNSVIVNIDPDPALHEAVPVKVMLSEAKARHISFGAGYSSNNGARGEIAYRDYNLLDHAWNLGSGLRLEQNRQRLFGTIDTLPDALGYRLAWGAHIESTNIQGLETTNHALSVARSRTQSQIETRLGLNWQREQRKPADSTSESIQALVPDWRWIRRTVNDPLYPRRGDVTEISIGGASRVLLSDQDFLRALLRYQIWWPMGRRDTLSLRGEAGFTAAQSRFGIPQEYLFRAGGSQSVRGYAHQSLGVQEGSAIVGGRTLATGSLEYTHWFSRDWGAALFTDTGGAADSWRDLRLFTGYGAGARWRSPVGPLALDLAWGREAEAMRLHFSLAVAF
ncbi:MAG: autotransporter assembly complex protein TamA [Sulfuricella denitrificans]|nr:autotransporter assembly complex protein TamA [Sulfuricella denitrificans]